MYLLHYRSFLICSEAALHVCTEKCSKQLIQMHHTQLQLDQRFYGDSHKLQSIRLVIYLTSWCERVILTNSQIFGFSYCIVANFRCCKISWKCLQTPHVNWRNNTEWWSKEALCNNGLVFFYVEAYTIMKVSRLQPWARNWLIEQKDSALLIFTSTTSEGLLQVHWHFVY